MFDTANSPPRFALDYTLCFFYHHRVLPTDGYFDNRGLDSRFFKPRDQLYRPVPLNWKVLTLYELEIMETNVYFILSPIQLNLLTDVALARHNDDSLEHSEFGSNRCKVPESYHQQQQCSEWHQYGTTDEFGWLDRRI